MAWRHSFATRSERRLRLPWNVSLGSGVERALGPLPFVREHRADVLRFRMGVASSGVWLSDDLSRTDLERAARDPDLVFPVDPLSPDVWRWNDQNSRRPLLAGFHLHAVPLRNPASAESAQQIFSPSS